MMAGVEESSSSLGPIKVVFVPGRALQGEDIPCYILWETHPVSAIRVNIPEPLELKEIYNVPDGAWSIDKGILTVTRVEIDGYLGLLFASSSLEEVSRNVSVGFEFVGRGEEKPIVVSKPLRLYRPLLTVEHVPDLIRFDIEHQRVSSGIKLRNLGQGTVILGVEVEGEGVTIKEPPGVLEFRQNLAKDVAIGFEKLKQEYPKNGEILDQFVQWIIKPPNLADRETLEKLRRLDETFDELDEQFFTRMVEVLIDAWRGNVHFTTVQQQLLHYLNSIGTKRILLHEPLNVLQFTKTRTRLKLRLLPANMMFQRYDPIDVPSIEVEVDKAGELPVYKLFQW